MFGAYFFNFNKNALLQFFSIFLLIFTERSPPRRAECRGSRALRARAGRGGGAGAAALRAGGPSGARRELRAELQVRADLVPSC